MAAPLQGFAITLIGHSHSAGLLRKRDQPDADSSTLKHNTDNRQISMFPTEFEPTIPSSKRQHTHDLDLMATVICKSFFNLKKS